MTSRKKTLNTEDRLKTLLSSGTNFGYDIISFLRRDPEGIALYATSKDDIFTNAIKNTKFRYIYIDKPRNTFLTKEFYQFDNVFSDEEAIEKPFLVLIFFKIGS